MNKSYLKIVLDLSASTCVGLSRLLMSPWPSWPQQLLPHVYTTCSIVTMVTWELPTATFKKRDAVHKMYYQLCTIMLLIEKNQIFEEITDSPLEYKL